ncbi:MAG: hypothetical protein FDZ70_06860 [Actinobacteria bacterium]|nr:MAG: hypothetical protein FDZ70_06860 [Actinomycetota bacterium]
MSIIIVAALLIVGLVGAAVLAIGVPAVLGLVAYGSAEERKAAKAESKPVAEAEKTAKAERKIYLERGVARGFVILGGAFWAIAAFAGLYSYQQTGMGSALMAAAVPLLATAATLVIGWYWERVAAALLAVATAAAVVWGVAHGFEIGVWILTTLALLGPMATASALFWMARRDQEALEFSFRLSSMGEPARQESSH